MKFLNCLSPNKVYNKYIGEELYTDCRVCSACRVSRQKSLVERIEDEAKEHKHLLFVTLTYDESNVPKYDILTSHQYPNITILYNGRKAINVSDVKDDIYLDSMESINIVDKRDAQLFIKRFRRYAEYYLNKYGYDNEKKQPKGIRYFLCSEYTPSTLRPHYHALFFVDNDFYARYGKQILLKAWQLGFTKYKYANRGACSYLAKYVYSVINSSPLYQHKEIRPWYLSSRRPAIGTRKDYGKEIQKYFFGDAITKSVWIGKEAIDIELSPFVESRLFPKFKSFEQISNPNRVRLLQAALFFDRSQLRKGDQEEVILLFDWLYRKIPNFRKQTDNIVIEVKRAHLLQYNSYAWKAYKFCKEYSCTLEDYLLNIERYYNRKKLYKLGEFYKMQDELIQYNDVGVKDLLHLYPIYRDSIVNTPFHRYKLTDKLILKTFGYDKKSPVSSQIRSYEQLRPYLNLVSKSRDTIRENMRTKHIRDNEEIQLNKIRGLNPYNGCYYG